MVQRRDEIHLQIQQLVDVAVLALAFWLSHQLRWRATVWLDLECSIAPFREFIWILAVILLFAPVVLESQGVYQNPVGKSPWKTLERIVRGMLWFGVIIAACVVSFRAASPSRGVLVGFAVLGTAGLWIRVALYRLYLRRLARRDGVRDRVLFAGSPDDIERTVGSLPDDLRSGMDVVARFDLEHRSLGELVECLHRHAVDRVIFAADHAKLNLVEEAIGACEIEGVEAWLVADFIRTQIARPSFEMIGGRPVMVFRSAPDFTWALVFKAVMDRVGAAALLVLSAPLCLVATVGIRLSSPGPILFRQKRSGKHGRPFTMYKFRTMATDAEMRLTELEAFNQMSGPVFKVDDDPRVTPFGRWLRRTSIDELPQLVNVLQGHMSLVGPRPLPLYETERFEDVAHRRRLSMKPGMTCLWQISGRSEVRDFRDWVKLDLEYIDRWSPWLDIEILIKTIPVVLAGLGAR